MRKLRRWGSVRGSKFFQTNCSFVGDWMRQCWRLGAKPAPCALSHSKLSTVSPSFSVTSATISPIVPCHTPPVAVLYWKNFRRRRHATAVGHPVAPLDHDFLAHRKLDIDGVPDALEFPFLSGRCRLINAIAVIHSPAKLTGPPLAAVHKSNEVLDRPGKISAIVDLLRRHRGEVGKADRLARGGVAFRVEKDKGRADMSLLFAEEISRCSRTMRTTLSGPRRSPMGAGPSAPS